MYRYDEFDQSLVDARVTEFRGQVARRLAGDITEDEFKPLRLMNGLYLQLHAYMLRVAIPYGTFNSRQMHMLAEIARKYDKGYGHFTTRQNIQYNWLKLDDVPDLLADLASVEMHAIQTSGNCIRNTTSDQYAGAAADEIEDPRPTCEIIRQWSTFHPEFSFLPRKFKIAVTGAPKDRAAVQIHDIGIQIVENNKGEVGYSIFVGGGLGRTPMVGKHIRAFLPRQDLLAYLEAIMRVYNMLGRRDNIYKARIKILVHEASAAEFTRLVEEEFEKIDQTKLMALPEEELDRIAAYFAAPEFETLGPCPAEHLEALDRDRDFALWVKANVVPHKVPGYAIANISLKPIGGVPGDITSDQMDGVAELAKDYSFDEIRATHEQNLVLPHVRERDLYAIWQRLKALELATANIGLVSDIIACPGLDYCNLANARSIPVAQLISERFAELDRQHDIGELKIKISGCINACGHHHVGHIGILGVDRKGEEYYQITLGGSADENTRLGDITGPSFPYDKVVDAVETLVTTYVDLRQSGETFLQTYARVGLAPFKENLYAAA
ncbi:MAG: nitrite/sulfite reductase [Alphaproteobacteria bacterium]|nr:MAG: nitrite/sulfite reductase [Alphaproteobacteria bacterium]